MIVCGLATHLGIERGLGEKDGMLLGCNAQFVIISMVPNLFHIVPVSDDAMLDGVLETEDTPLCLGFISAPAVSACT